MIYWLIGAQNTKLLFLMSAIIFMRILILIHLQNSYQREVPWVCTPLETVHHGLPVEEEKDQ